MAKDKKPKPRNQQRVPGTELPEIESLTEAAEAYRTVRNDRQALNIQEHEQDGHLKATIERLIEEGEITLDPKIKDGEAQVIYRYEDGDGNIQEVKYTRSEAKVKVNKSKVAHAGEAE